MMVILKNALASIKAYKLRVFTALLWIVLGITSVIVVASAGNGLEKMLDNILYSNDDRIGRIGFYATDYNLINPALSLQPFGEKELEVISLVNGVESVAPAKDDDNQGSWGVNYGEGFEQSYMEVQPYNELKKPEILYGRDFTFEDEDRRVLIVSDSIADYLTEGQPEKIIGQSMTIDDKKYEVVGVTPRTFIDGMFGKYHDFGYVPQKVFNGIVKHYWRNDSYGVDKIDVKVAKGFDKKEVLNNVNIALAEARPDGDVNYYFMDEEAENIKFVLKLSIMGVIGAITLVSLAIGGLGVMNIMYMAVIERKREIGIRRAIGAKPRDIIIQFITEAGIITTLGGIIGIVLGIVVTLLVGNKLPFEIIIKPIDCVFAAVASGVAGVVFGAIPAIKASKVDPIKAIRG
ncbi:MAG: ABC transporter permease [Sarcina sp.]